MCYIKYTSRRTMLMLFKVLIVLFLRLETTCATTISYEKYFSKYNIVDFHQLGSRNKQTVFLNTCFNRSNRKVDLEVKFSSFGKIFHMLLSEDKLFQEVLLKSHDGAFSQNNSLQAKFYEGCLKDDLENSSILGYLLDGLFTGRITHLNKTYFIEPEDLFFQRKKTKSKRNIVYRDADIRPHEWEIFSEGPKDLPEWKVLYRSANISTNITVENSGIDIDNVTENLFCEVEIVADHTLFNFFQNDTEKLTAFLYLHGKYADYVFRRTDFNMDGRPDGIRIATGRISIYKTDKDNNYPMRQATSLSEYLTLFVSRKQDPRFCLSIAIFYRQFDGMAIGEAFKADLRDGDAIGGICDPPLLNSVGYDTISFNTGVVNMQLQNGQPVPLAITMLAFTHEIGHGFGSGHDPLNDPKCSPGKTSNYLMYPASAYGSKNALKLSQCSRRAIKEVLLFKGSCLKYGKSYCGNGIREGEEECDCGKEKFCNLTDPCCTPSDVSPPEKGCTIRSKKGYECSPKESECCNKNCLIMRNVKQFCYSGESECSYSYCDGKSATCPKSQNSTEFCAPKYTCDNTTCSNTTCATLGLGDCFCTAYLAIQCLQCCQKGNNCTPASDLGMVDHDGSSFILPAGTSCNNGLYECNGVGNCVSTPYRNNTSSELYISMVVIPFFMIVLLIFLISAFCKGRSKSSIRITRASNV